MSKMLISEVISKEEWLKNKDEYDFILVDRDVAVKSSPSTAVTLAIIEWKDTLNTSILKEYTNIGNRTLKRHIEWLRDNGYLKRLTLTQEDIKEVVLNNKTSNVCEWCDCYSYVLHEHHYPVPKRRGGIDTVNICPNCHLAFHKIEIERNGGWENE